MKRNEKEDIRAEEKRMPGNALKQARETSPYTQEEIAQVLETKRQTYSAYERGISVPDALTLKTLAGLLGISIDSLLNHTSSPDCFTEYYRIIFSENVTGLLKSKNITQKELAKDLVSQISKVADFCNGKKMPSNCADPSISRSPVPSVDIEQGSYITPRKLDALTKALCTTKAYLLGETPDFYKGELSCSDADKDLLVQYQKLNKENQSALIKYIDFLLSNP